MRNHNAIKKITELLNGYDQRIVWGTGGNGERLHDLFVNRAKESIAFFVDSKLPANEENRFHDIPAFGVDALDRLYDSKKHLILVASRFYEEIKTALFAHGLEEYVHFVDATCEDFNVAFHEWTLRCHLQTEGNKCPALPELIELETINRCNGSCGFCPVNRRDDPRCLAAMSDGLFYRIIDQLRGFEFSGRIALFSNNEPFLDKKIAERLRFVRNALPKAHSYLYTNGTLLTMEKFIEIMEYLDDLIIDNYSDALRLHPNIEDIYEYANRNYTLQRRVHIYLRRENEVLTTRGGQAPNQKIYDAPEFLTCVLPFKQMVIRPDGKVSLCCNDALGKYTLGDLTKERILDVWRGRVYREIRKRILKSRKGLDLCEHCDNVFDYHTKSSDAWFSGNVSFEDMHKGEILYV